jgi:hypothetical protein
MVKLEGAARFLHMPAGEGPAFADTAIFGVFTEAGLIATSGAEFRVSARGDTTDVEVLRRANAPAPTPEYVPDYVVISSGPGGRVGTLFLREGEIGRLQPRRQPLKLRAVPGDPLDNNPLFQRLLKGLPGETK